MLNHAGVPTLLRSWSETSQSSMSSS